MPDYILRIEGQNFGDTVYNTNDLSTIRGSSLCLEAFGYELEDAFKDEAKARSENVELLYAAAAQAVFRLHDMSDGRAADFETLARRTLAGSYRQGAQEPPFADWPTLQKWKKLTSKDRLRYLQMPSEHMTFAIAREEIIAGDWRTALHRALWRNRRQQMQQPNLPRQDLDVGDLVCPIDPNRFVARDPEACGAIVRATKGQFAKTYDLDPPNMGSAIRRFGISRRSADLRTYGRDARRTVYAVTLGPEILIDLHGRGLFEDFDFSQSFEDLVAEPPKGLDLPVSLRGKLGFLYFDGTGFGDIRAKTDIVDFSKAVRKVVRETTRKLLTHYLTEADRHKTNAYGLRKPTFRRTGQSDFLDNEITRLRLETLMSGGEDMSLVVPAWLAWDIGWRMLGWFRDAGKQAVPGEHGTKHDLIFRAGLLVCDAKTPARRATAAAHAICDDAGKHPDKKGQPVLGFHIVEGFDVPEVGGIWAETVGSERQKVFGAGAPGPDQLAEAFRLSETDRPAFESGVRRFKKEFARSQLYRLIGELEASYRAGTTIGGHEARDFLDEQLKLHRFRSDAGMDLNVFLANLPGPKDAGVLFRMKLLTDVWDYIDPLGEDSVAGAGQ